MTRSRDLPVILAKTRIRSRRGRIQEPQQRTGGFSNICGCPHLLAGRRGGLERHRTLAATLDWSYDLLLTQQAALLRAVSVFSGRFSLDGAIAVADIPAVEVADNLAELTAKSPLTVNTDGNEVGYRLLETTRVYCLERLQGSGEEQSVRRRHGEYICGLLERAAGDRANATPRNWAYARGQCLDDLRAALDWLGVDAEDPSLAIRLTVVGSLLWNHFSLTKECRVRVSKAVGMLDAAEVDHQPRCLRTLKRSGDAQ